MKLRCFSWTWIYFTIQSFCRSFVLELIRTDCFVLQSASCLLGLPLRVICPCSCHPICLHSVCLLSPPLTLLSFFLQEEKGISCELVDLDFLKCAVGFPFMRAQTKVICKIWYKIAISFSFQLTACYGWEFFFCINLFYQIISPYIYFFSSIILQ